MFSINESNIIETDTGLYQDLEVITSFEKKPTTIYWRDIEHRLNVKELLLKTQYEMFEDPNYFACFYALGLLPNEDFQEITEHCLNRTVRISRIKDYLETKQFSNDTEIIIKIAIYLFNPDYLTDGLPLYTLKDVEKTNFKAIQEALTICYNRIY